MSKISMKFAETQKDLKYKILHEILLSFEICWQNLKYRCHFTK